jgi:hypothetical protein
VGWGSNPKNLTSREINMISFTESATLISIKRRRNSRFELPMNILRDAYDRVNMSMSDSEPLIEAEFLEDVEFVAEVEEALKLI